MYVKDGLCVIVLKSFVPFQCGKVHMEFCFKVPEASIATCLLPVVCNMKEVIVFIENIFGSRYGIYLAETIAGTYRTFRIG